ncbi:hypothetical protein QFC22_004414 [Naganishia vaughanmartiniae]|uniref:Uncharacterized protein n=1 Tax=Naganishia vaughanmartiniae TaxID=1424756 RepID=A0ACC2X0H9_9TREE|nr:hypothetical protein QFC22_004414 [Naganishia vaughanmartiniae]
MGLKESVAPVVALIDDQYHKDVFGSRHFPVSTPASIDSTKVQYLREHFVGLQEMMEALKNVNTGLNTLSGRLSGLELDGATNDRDSEETETTRFMKFAEGLESDFCAAFSEYVREWGLHGVNVYTMKIARRLGRLDREPVMIRRSRPPLESSSNGAKEPLLTPTQSARAQRRGHAMAHCGKQLNRACSNHPSEPTMRRWSAFSTILWWLASHLPKPQGQNYGLTITLSRPQPHTEADAKNTFPRCCLRVELMHKPAC